MKRRIIKVLYVLCVFLLYASIINYSVAADPNEIYDVLGSGNNPLANATGTIIGIIRWVGVAILIGAIMVKGIKYITASPEGKADIKKDIIMLVIGAVLLFAITTLVDIIYDLVGQAGLRETSILERINWWRNS